MKSTLPRRTGAGGGVIIFLLLTSASERKRPPPWAWAVYRHARTAGEGFSYGRFERRKKKQEETGQPPFLSSCPTGYG